MISIELQQLFAEAIGRTADSRMRDRFERLGIETIEARVRSPAPNAGPNCYMETLPISDRISGYFATIDWNDRADLQKILTIVNESLRQLDRNHASGIIERIDSELYKVGLEFDGMRIAKAGD